MSSAVKDNSMFKAHNIFICFEYKNLQFIVFVGQFIRLGLWSFRSLGKMSWVNLLFHYRNLLLSFFFFNFIVFFNFLEAK